MTERLRITGGMRRNRRLLSPPKDTIRPASDMIRQAVFNMLGAAVEGVTFYDVFAGTGIVGLEALSRGARKAVFIELERLNLQLIRKNLDLARFGHEASVRGSDAFVWGKHYMPEEGPVMVFLGPPYPLYEGAGKQKLFDLVENLIGRLDDDDWLILQFPREMDAAELSDQEHWVRLRRYGKTQIGIWHKGEGLIGVPLWSGDEEASDGATAGADRAEAEHDAGPLANA